MACGDEEGCSKASGDTICLKILLKISALAHHSYAAHSKIHPLCEERKLPRAVEILCVNSRKRKEKGEGGATTKQTRSSANTSSNCTCSAIDASNVPAAIAPTTTANRHLRQRRPGGLIRAIDSSPNPTSQRPHCLDLKQHTIALQPHGAVLALQALQPHRCNLGGRIDQQRRVPNAG